VKPPTSRRDDVFAAPGIDLARREQPEAEIRAALSAEQHMIALHGIKNCDTMKKARAWLDGQGVAYRFHDYKAEGIDRAILEGWVRQVGWEALLNRAGTTFRKLPDAEKQELDEGRAVALMLAQPSMIKRPVLVAGDRILVGFSPESYATLR
jgi:arsenate reductase